MTKTIDKVVPDQPSAKNKNDENCENETPITIPSKVSGDIETALDTPKNALITTQEKDNINQTTTTVVSLKSPFEAEFSTDDNVTQQTIAVASTAVMNNDRVTTPITLQFRPPKDAPSFNVAQRSASSQKYLFSNENDR